MNVLCFVKFTPDTRNFIYNYETNVLERESSRLILNPDDACAAALALKLKAAVPDTHIELVTMGPGVVAPLIRDLLRLGIDRGVILSDKSFAGSDTYATSKVLARYAVQSPYDLILTGSHTLDGDTAHIPSQIADWLNLTQYSGAVSLDMTKLTQGEAVVTSLQDELLVTVSMPLPAVVSVRKEMGLKLPFVRYADLNLNVDDRLCIMSGDELGLPPDETGFVGSLTKVSRTFVKTMEKKERKVVSCDAEGIDIVMTYLKDHGFLDGESTFG